MKTVRLCDGTELPCRAYNMALRPLETLHEKEPQTLEILYRLSRGDELPLDPKTQDQLEGLGYLIGSQLRPEVQVLIKTVVRKRGDQLIISTPTQ